MPSICLYLFAKRSPLSFRLPLSSFLLFCRTSRDPTDPTDTGQKRSRNSTSGNPGQVEKAACSRDFPHNRGLVLSSQQTGVIQAKNCNVVVKKFAQMAPNTLVGSLFFSPPFRLFFLLAFVSFSSETGFPLPFLWEESESVKESFAIRCLPSPSTSRPPAPSAAVANCNEIAQLIE